jgi:hypothetical protein
LNRRRYVIAGGGNYLSMPQPRNAKPQQGATMSEKLDPTAGMSPKELRRWLDSDDPSDHPWKSREHLAEDLAQEAEPDRLEQQQRAPDWEDDRLTYSQRVFAAYKSLAEEMQSPDVTIDALHRRVGRDIRDLHRWLKWECMAHRASPSIGEPLYAGDAARQSALHLPGEKDALLRVKLLQLPVANLSPEIATDVSRFQVKVLVMTDGAQQPRIAINLTAEQARLLAVVIQYGSEGLDAQDFLWDLEKELRAFASNPQAYVEQRRPAAHETYAKALRIAAYLRYPERTPELEQKIERTIQKRLGESRQEQQVRAYEASLRRTVAEKHPNLTQAQAEHYETRIKELVETYRQEQIRKQ